MKKKSLKQSQRTLVHYLLMVFEFSIHISSVNEHHHGHNVQRIAEWICEIELGL